MGQKLGLKGWGLCLLASLGLHGLLLGLSLQYSRVVPQPKKVVAVEAVCLAASPGPQGGKSGGGEPAPGPPAPPAAKKPPPPPKVKPKPPRPKPKPQAVAPPKPEPAPIPASLAIPRPAPAPTPSRVASTASYQAAGNSRGRGSPSGGVGRGSGDGRGSGSGLGSGHGRGGGGNILGAYLATVRRLLEKHKRYPGEARRQWQQGVVVLSFTISQDGGIAHTRVSRSSGYPVLDEAARETLKRLSRFPPIPSQLNRSHLAIEVPLAFRLREG